MSVKKVYIAYADADVKWLQRLRSALYVLQSRGVEIWDRSQIPAGRVWREDLQRAIDSSSVMVVLLTADYFASPFNGGEELPALLKARRQNGTELIPLLVRACFYDNFPEVAKLVPLDAQPLASFNAAAIDDRLNVLAKQVAQLLVSRPASAPSPGDPQASSTGPARRTPTRSSLRKLINEVIKRDSQLDSFLLDHFLDVYRELTRGMERAVKVNLLLESKDLSVVLERLREEFPEETARHASLLRFED